MDVSKPCCYGSNISCAIGVQDLRDSFAYLNSYKSLIQEACEVLRLENTHNYKRGRERVKLGFFRLTVNKENGKYTKCFTYLVGHKKDLL